MNKFKIPALIFGAVFVASAIALILYIKNDTAKKTSAPVDAPAWVHKNGSSGMQPISGKIASSGNHNNATNNTSDAKPQKDSQGSNRTNEKENKPDRNKTDEMTAGKAITKIQKVIVTEIFLDNLASYIADNYHPVGSIPNNQKAGYSSAGFKSINTYFGLNLRGLTPESESLDSARREIWSELLSPGTLTKLYETYNSDLLDIIEEKGILAERKFMLEGDSYELRELTRKQRAEMFKVSTFPLRHVAAILNAIAENRDLIQAMDGYIKAEKRVDIANGIFQSDLNQSQNSNSVAAKNRATHSGKILKDAITVREKIKEGITSKIKSFCAGICETPDDSFYIAKWVFRRIKDKDSRIESILSGSRILNKIADDMERRAELIERKI
ncbi:hypothetical protein [Maridesulfovibrio zosterae]|uniref:hypothetical protein n=1 Tax=Maridesulfovibrio zosterae TaxID=82171 RepID=UPI00041D62ED|nr:hypothetical protein [Maridesulfovibrio zosterae]